MKIIEKPKNDLRKLTFSKCVEISMHIGWFCNGNQLTKNIFYFFAIKLAFNMLILIGNFNNFRLSWKFHKNFKKTITISCNRAWSQTAWKHECTCVNMLMVCNRVSVSGVQHLFVHQEVLASQSTRIQIECIFNASDLNACYCIQQGAPCWIQ